MIEKISLRPKGSSKLAKAEKKIMPKVKVRSKKYRMTEGGMMKDKRY